MKAAWRFPSRTCMHVGTGQDSTHAVRVFHHERLLTTCTAPKRWEAAQKMCIGPKYKATRAHAAQMLYVPRPSTSTSANGLLITE
jgi:hypothetical protein